ncbi:MAG TPA: DUF3343 domain-containing protein [Methanocorpusculum sp.]|nr:DUF3343 domain-containing protein [Methanocorpusculum sp.]
MEDTVDLNYYILFANYTQGMELREILKENHLPSQISPTPRSIQGPLTCGMSLLITEENIQAVRACIEKNKAEYFDIVAIPCQIQPGRNKFC